MLEAPDRGVLGCAGMLAAALVRVLTAALTNIASKSTVEPGDGGRISDEWLDQECRQGVSVH
jgi:hypothetical protein